MPEPVSGVPEILDGLREAAARNAELGWPAQVVAVEQAVAAVHAAADAHNWRTVHQCPSCNRYFDSPSVCSDGTHTVEQEERVPSGAWPDQSAQHAVLLDEIRELHQENERLRAASPDERLREAAQAWLDQHAAMGGGPLSWASQIMLDFLAAADREAPDEPRGEKITHGRHCTCTPCAVEDWTNPALAPCGMHGKGCPQEYQPLGPAGSFTPPADDPKETTT